MNEFPINPLQAMVDGMGAAWKKERAKWFASVIDAAWALRDSQGPRQEGK